MSELPFAITQEAATQIERLLLDAQKDLKLLAMARVLGYATSSSWSNPEGGGGWYPFPHVVLGWHPVEEVIGSSEYTELELVERREAGSLTAQGRVSNTPKKKARTWVNALRKLWVEFEKRPILGQAPQRRRK